jgi:branched-subunit amino acid aminotransferase/4-amino-4-deoxychorismate lyase
MTHEIVYGDNQAAEQLFVWESGDRLVPCPPTEDSLLAADSWLVEGGSVRALTWHEKRFKVACQQTGYRLPDDLRAFWAEVVQVLPRHGRWFPRIELTAAAVPQLRLRLRPAPAQADQVRVWVASDRDQRHVPRRKGPDLPWLNRIRVRAAGLGADEALLTTPTGLLLEAAHSSVLWWEDDTLCVPSPAMRVLPGITTSLIQQEARRRLLEVRPRRQHLAQLSGREVWLVNALHGIRPVAAWIGASIPPGEPEHVRAWRSWWDNLLEPLRAD